jgi:hypothetical protein
MQLDLFPYAPQRDVYRLNDVPAGCAGTSASR